MKKLEIFKDIGKTNSYLIVFLAFSLPLSVAGVNAALIFMALFFLYERAYRERFLSIKKNPFVYLMIAIVVMHVVGCLWSDNMAVAMGGLGKVKKYFWIPFLMMYVKKEHIVYYFQGFILGMMISEVLTYLVWLDVIPFFGYANEEFPSPLMKHFDYTVYAAMALFLLLYLLLFKKEKSKGKKSIAIFFTLTMLLNLFFTGGRAGQVGFFILLLALILNYFKGRVVKGISVFTLVSFLMFFLSYQFIPLFKARVDKGVNAVTHFQPGTQTTSLGMRFGLNINYYTIFKEHPLMGVGTGDYIDEYRKVNEKSLYKTPVMNPHNMYMLMAVQFGIFGLIIFLLPFLYQIYYGIKIKDDLQVMRIAFPIFFLAIMLVYWYLYAFKTLMLFVFFSAILYHQYDSKVKILEEE